MKSVLAMKQQSSNSGGGLAVILVLLGLFGMIFLIWNVLDGVIYYHGDGIARADHPIAFWIVAALFGFAFGNLVYWPIRAWWNRKSSPRL